MQCEILLRKGHDAFLFCAAAGRTKQEDTIRNEECLRWWEYELFLHVPTWVFKRSDLPNP